MSVAQAIKTIEDVIQSLPAPSEMKDAERKELLSKLEIFKARVQTPVETTWELVQGVRNFLTCSSSQWPLLSELLTLLLGYEACYHESRYRSGGFQCPFSKKRSRCSNHC